MMHLQRRTFFHHDLSHSLANASWPLPGLFFQALGSAALRQSSTLDQLDRRFLNFQRLVKRSSNRRGSLEEDRGDSDPVARRAVKDSTKARSAYAVLDCEDLSPRGTQACKSISSQLCTWTCDFIMVLIFKQLASSHRHGQASWIAV